MARTEVAVITVVLWRQRLDTKFKNLPCVVFALGSCSIHLFGSLAGGCCEEVCIQSELFGDDLPWETGSGQVREGYELIPTAKREVWVRSS